MSITCKAAVIRDNSLSEPYEISKPLSIEDIKISPPLENEILVKVMGAGLCHSDLSVINGSRIMPLPLVLGHEGSGEVVELGCAVKDIKVGDHVSFQFSPSCGRCRRCLEGRPQVCELAAATKGKGELMSGGSRLSDLDGNVLNHHCLLYMQAARELRFVYRAHHPLKPALGATRNGVCSRLHKIIARTPICRRNFGCLISID